MRICGFDSRTGLHNRITCLSCIINGSYFRSLRFPMALCKECDSPTATVFCSRHCSVTWNNRNRPKRSRTKTCKGCGVEKITSQYTFCTTCIGNRLHIHTAKSLDECNWDDGRRRYLLRNRPHQCQQCLETQWLGLPIPLEMDHIDGNSDNNAEDNLRLICPNCHAQSPFNKGKNRGRGRTRQRISNQRYAEGLKY